MKKRVMNNNYYSLTGNIDIGKAIRRIPTHLDINIPDQDRENYTTTNIPRPAKQQENTKP